MLYILYECELNSWPDTSVVKAFEQNSVVVGSNTT